MKYKEAIKKLNEWNVAYYNLNSPIVDDDEYDKLYKKVKSYEKKNPDKIDPKSPTQRISSDNIKGFKKYKHRVPMLSISNLYSDDEVRDFVEKTNEKLECKAEYVAELKIDGASLSLDYDGELKRAVTRGDGEKGDVVTSNALTISNIPKVFNTIPRTIRGEVIILQEDFLKINSKLPDDKKKANARNLASGSLKLKDSDECSKRKLKFIAYSIVEGGENKHSTDLNYLRKSGFNISKNVLVTNSVEKLINFCHKMEKERDKLPYRIDGIVIKVDDKTAYPKLGGTSKSPHYLGAYKFPAEQKSVKIIDVEYSVGRTGTITPVAIFKGVQLADTLVKRATLHNFDEVSRLGIRIGDYVFLEKSGDIIPKVLSKDTTKKVSIETKAIKIPKKCPVCKGDVKKDKTLVAVKCSNPNCSIKFRSKFELFASKRAMDMDGIGPAMIENICSKIKRIDQLYTLTEKDLLRFEGVKTKTARNTINAIQGSKNAGLEKVLVGLGIPNIGRTSSKRLAKKFKDIDTIMNASVTKLQKVEGIKDMANDIYTFFRNTKNIRIINGLKKHGVSMIQEKVKGSSNKLDGKTFVITGSLSEKRDVIKERIENAGGKVSGAVSGNTNYLVAGDNVGKTKLNKAKACGTKIISENELSKMI